MTEGKSYTCAVCGRTLISPRSDAEALAEAEERYGGPIPEDEREVVCDDCHQPFMEWFNSLTPADHEAIRRGDYER